LPVATVVDGETSEFLSKGDAAESTRQKGECQQSAWRHPVGWHDHRRWATTDHTIELYSASNRDPNNFLSKLAKIHAAAHGSVAHVDFAGQAVDSGGENSAGDPMPTPRRLEFRDSWLDVSGRRNRQG
jgi:hypothetical protein